MVSLAELDFWEKFLKELDKSVVDRLEVIEILLAGIDAGESGTGSAQAAPAQPAKLYQPLVPPAPGDNYVLLDVIEDSLREIDCQLNEAEQKINELTDSLTQVEMAVQQDEEFRPRFTELTVQLENMSSFLLALKSRLNAISSSHSVLWNKLQDDRLHPERLLDRAVALSSVLGRAMNYSRSHGHRY